MPPLWVQNESRLPCGKMGSASRQAASVRAPKKGIGDRNGKTEKVEGKKRNGKNDLTHFVRDSKSTILSQKSKNEDCKTGWKVERRSSVLPSGNTGKTQEICTRSSQYYNRTGTQFPISERRGRRENTIASI